MQKRNKFPEHRIQTHPRKSKACHSPFPGKHVKEDFQTSYEHSTKYREKKSEWRLNHHINDDFPFKFFPWNELGTVICNITSFSNKTGRLGGHTNIIYTWYREDKWQKGTWLTSRWGSWSSDFSMSSCALTLPATPSTSIPFPTLISQGNVQTPYSYIPRTSLLLPGNTRNTPTASSSPISIPRSSKLMHNPSKQLQPGDQRLSDTHLSWAGPCCYQVSVVIQITGEGRKGETLLGANAPAAVLPGVIQQKQGVLSIPLSPGSYFYIMVISTSVLWLLNTLQSCMCLKARRCSATPELVNKGVSGLTAPKKAWVSAAVLQSWLHLRGFKWDGQQLPPTLQSISLCICPVKANCNCSQVIQSCCEQQQVSVWKLTGKAISESLRTFGDKGSIISLIPFLSFFFPFFWWRVIWRQSSHGHLGEIPEEKQRTVFSLLLFQ